MAHDVFICHASQDSSVANAVVQRLEEADYRCWIAPRDPIAGIPYARQLVEAINDARVMLLIFSENSLRSEHVLRELEIASQAHTTVVPMRIQDVLPTGDVRYYISNVHWMDATAPPLEERLTELVKAIGELLGVAERPQAPAAPPPAAKASAIRTNLPAQITRFVGRADDIAAIVELLRNHRLVTLSGAGGVGKTRCAIEAARSLMDGFEDGVWFVDLSPIRDATDILTALATAMGLPVSGGAGLETLVAQLGKQRALLIVDNCEHLMEPVREFIMAAGTACPNVTILATSREAFNVYGENLYRMPSLSADDSVRLFSERAQAANARFELSNENAPFVAEICRRLDGIPLAIELAAARVKMLAPRQLAQRLAEKIGTLSASDRHGSARQRTLRATFDWSYDLLSDQERTLLRRLAIFVGTFPVDVAGTVCHDERLDPDDIFMLLESLVDKSLVQPEVVGQDTRYRLLESLHEYAAEKLQEAGETAPFARAHALAYVELAEDGYRGWGGPDAIWLPQATSDLANFRAALKWAFSEGNDVLAGQRIAGALRSIWSRFDPVEGCRWIGAALERVTVETPPDVVARLHVVRAQLSMTLADAQEALPEAREALRLYTDLNDERGIAEGQLFAGAATGLLGNPAEGKELLTAALATFRRLRADRQIGSTLQYLALVHLIEGDIDGARSLLSEALVILRATPGADRAVTHMAQALAEAEFQSGDAETALKLAHEALEHDRARHDDVLMVFDLCNICAYLIALQRFDEAAEAACEALEVARKVEVHMGATVAFQRLAAIAALRPGGGGQGEDLHRTAAQMIGFVDARMTASRARRDFTEQQEYDKTVECLRVIIGEAELEILRASGSNWTESEAAAVADRIRESACKLSPAR